MLNNKSVKTMNYLQNIHFNESEKIVLKLSLIYLKTILISGMILTKGFETETA